MEEWKQDKLIDLLDSLIDYRGKTPRKVDKGIPLITAKIVKNGRIDTPTEFLDIEDYDNWMVRGFPKNGDVILTTEAPLGEVAQLDDNKIALAQRIVCLRGKEGVLDNTFLKYFLLSSLGQARLKARETGTTVTGIKQSELKEVLIDYPPYKYQKQITSILKSLDDKIELNRHINENLEQQAQALFKSWFVDFEPFKDGKFVDSELGMIPEGWRVGYYTELVDIKGGGTPKTNIKEFWNGSIPFFSPKDIGPSCFVLNTEKYITTNGLENCNSNLFPPYSVFITARGTVGKVVMVGSEMAMNQSNYALLGKQNISQFYVYLITLQLVSHLLKKANGAVFNAITTRDFASERIIIPFYSIIKSFSSIVKPIYENILLNEFQIKSLSQLRDTLLPRLMSGELKLSETTI